MENQFLDSRFDADTPQYKGYATFGQRLVALIIDGIIMNVMQSIIFFAFGINLVNMDTNSFENGLSASLGIGSFLSMCVNVAYYVYFESSEKQATFGKQAMGIVVTDMNGNRITPLKATGRFFAKIISAIVLLIGYLMQPFTEKKQALHDIIAGTLVYKK